MYITQMPKFKTLGWKLDDYIQAKWNTELQHYAVYAGRFLDLAHPVIK